MFFKRLLQKPYPIFLLFVLLCFLPLFRVEYSTDSYSVMVIGMRANGELMKENGRMISALFFSLAGALSADYTAVYYVSFLLALFFASLSVCLLYQLLAKVLPALPAALCSLLTLLNPFSIEYLLFPEKGIFWFGIFAAILALFCFVRFLEGKKNYLWFSYLFLALSSFSYQVLPGVFAVLSILFVLLLAKNRRAFLIGTGIAISVYGAGSLICFLSIRLFGKTERLGDRIRFANLGKALSYPFPGTEGSPLLLLPVLVGVLALLALIAFLFTHLFASEKTARSMFLLFAKLLFLFSSAAAVTLFPLLLVAPEEAWLPLRITYPFGTLVGAISALLFAQPRQSRTPERGRMIRRIVIGSFCAVLLAILVFFGKVTTDRLQNNAADEATCKSIGACIRAYEEANRVTVKKVCIYYDEHPRKTNPGVLQIDDCNVRAFTKPWSDVNHMRVILGRDFEKGEPEPEIYEANFACRDWDAFSPEQLVFVGDTLHLCVY